MAEQEITYIPYGQDEISQQDLMTNLANGLPDFVKSYKWLQKPGITEKFLNAYKDIINHGITGASDSSGLWEITHNGDKIDTSTMSPIDKQIYEHAAYYIQQKMAQMTPRKKEEEAAKKDLKDFNFINDFNTSILNEYGGQQALFSDPETGWNSLDPRGDNGLRGIDKRRDKVKTILQNYLRDYKDGQYNFEGTPFKDDTDVKTKVQKAIDALDTIDNTTDDVEAFNALGLPYRTYFSNGGNESTNKINPATGTPFTYNEWNKYQQEQKELKAKQVQQAAYNNTLFLYRVTNPKMQGQNPVALKQKYKDSNSLIAALQNYSQRDIRTLTPDEQSEVHGAYRNLATEPIDNNLFNRIKNSSSGFYKDSAPNRFRKIKGIDNLIWDSKLQQVIQLNNRQQQQAIQNQPQDLFANVQTSQEKLNKQQQEYMNSTEGGFTPAEQREVAALLFDLGAAVDPEGFSSAGLSQIAAGIRDYNRASDPEGWTWGDTGWATLDHGLGLLSAIPVVGGLVKGSWAAAKLGNYIPKMEKWIRLAGRAGSTYAMAANAPGALNTLEKIKKGEDLSLKDYQDLAYFFIGGLGHHQLNKGNRVERTAMKARGVETSNSVLNKAGITRTTAKSETTTKTTPTLKVKKTGEDGKVETKEISIDAEKQKILGKTKAEDLEAKAKELEIEIPEGYKIQPKSTTTKTWSRENINRYRGKGNKEIFGTKTEQSQTPSLKSDEEFEQYLSEHNNTWLKKIFNGSNKDIRRYDRYRGIKPIQEETSSETPKTETSTSENTKKTSNNITKENIKAIRENQNFKEYEDLMNYKKKDSSRETLKDGSEHTIEFGDKSYKFKYDGKNHSVIINGKKIDVKPEDGMEGVRREVAKFIEQQRRSTIKVGKLTKEQQKELVAKLKELKKKGFLKQGGTINPSLDEVIKDFINNNNI